MRVSRLLCLLTRINRVYGDLEIKDLLDIQVIDQNNRSENEYLEACAGGMSDPNHVELFIEKEN